MNLSQEKYDELVELTYATLEDKREWVRLLECLEDAVGGRAIHLLGFDNAHGALSFSDGADLPPQVDIEYIRKYQFIDPRTSLLRKMPLHEWLHCHEHFNEEFVASSPFYQEFLLPNDGRYLSGCKLIDDAEATVMLAFIRRVSDGPMPAEAVRFVERLRPHLRRAVRVGLKHFVYSTQALVGYALVDKLNQPVLLLTPDGHVVHHNAAARALLANTALVTIADGRLVLPERYQREFLVRCGQLEDQVRRADPKAHDPGFSSLHLSSAPGEAPDAIYGFFTTLLPERVMGSFGMRPLVMLFLYHPESAQHVDSTLLVAAFGLSQAECRVATLLAEGMPPKVIADTLGVQYDTVRKQLMSIYQKTSTNRQPELVRLLLHLPSPPPTGAPLDLHRA